MHGITGSTKVQRLAKVDERLEFFEIHEGESDVECLVSDVKTPFRRRF